MSLRYQFSINPILPLLSDLSNVEQWINGHEVRFGNPNLKPYRGYMNNLNYLYKKNRLTVQIFAYYQFSPNPIMSTSVERVDNDNDYYFVYGSANQKSFTQLQERFYTNFEIFKNSLYLTIYGGINHYLNKGNEYTHTYTGYFGAGQLESIYKNWSLSISLNSRLNSQFAETLYYGSKGGDVGLSYKYKALKIGMGIMNPFLSDGISSGDKSISSLVSKETWNFVKDNGNMIYLSFAWNFNYGRKHQPGQKNLNNSDTETGIVK